MRHTNDSILVVRNMNELRAHILIIRLSMFLGLSALSVRKKLLKWNARNGTMEILILDEVKRKILN